MTDDWLPILVYFLLYITSMCALLLLLFILLSAQKLEWFFKKSVSITLCSNPPVACHLTWCKIRSANDVPQAPHGAPTSPGSHTLPFPPHLGSGSLVPSNVSSTSSGAFVFALSCLKWSLRCEQACWPHPADLCMAEPVLSRHTITQLALLPGPCPHSLRG